MNDDDKTYQTSAITEKIQEVGKQISFLNNIERDGWIKGFSVQQLCQIADALEVKTYQLLIPKN